MCNVKNKFFVIIVFVTSVAYGQVQLLKDYDFNQGNYTLLGIRSESDRNKFADSLGEFYINDTSVLNAIKIAWIFDKPSPSYACGFHYNILICKNGLMMEGFNINLNCNEISTDKGIFYFETEKLRMFKNDVKKPFREVTNFDSLKEAREYKKNVLQDSSLILSENPDWAIFEGEFDFTYRCEEGTKICLEKEDSIISSIKAEIARTYPGENFEMSDRGGSWTEISQTIRCNKSLSDKFKLYYRDKDGYFGMWKPYQLSLYTYWRN